MEEESSLFRLTIGAYEGVREGKLDGPGQSNEAKKWDRLVDQVDGDLPREPPAPEPPGTGD